MGGISVSVRERDDVLTIWNTRSDLAEQSKIIEKIQELVPTVTFTANFYKGKSGVLVSLNTVNLRPFDDNLGIIFLSQQMHIL